MELSNGGSEPEQGLARRSSVEVEGGHSFRVCHELFVLPQFIKRIVWGLVNRTQRHHTPSHRDRRNGVRHLEVMTGRNVSRII